MFGYGSLMWNPGFPYRVRRPARLEGYHRAYMMYSTRNRGVPGAPGMVVTLAPGERCTGMVYRIEPGAEAEALAYLDEREGIGRAHRRVKVPLRLPGNGGGPPLNAWTYLPILTYCNYIWGVPARRNAELVAQGSGKTGSSLDYLRRMLEELERIDISEPGLESLLREAQGLKNGNGTQGAR